MLPQLTDKQVCSHLPRSNHGNCLSLSPSPPLLPSLSLSLSDRAAWLAGCPGGKTIAGFKANVTFPPAFDATFPPNKGRRRRREGEGTMGPRRRGKRRVRRPASPPPTPAPTSTFRSPRASISSSFCTNADNRLPPFVGRRKKGDFMAAN